MKLSRINQLLESLWSKADIQETLSPGSATRILPSEKELSRLAYLASQLCGLRRKSCKCSARILPRGRKKVERAESSEEDYSHGMILMAGDQRGTFKVGRF